MSEKEAPQLELQPVDRINMPSSSAPIGEEKGEFFEFEFDGKIVNFKLLSRGDRPKDTTSPNVSLTPHEEKDTISHEMSLHLEKREKIFNLMPDSTNAWLFINDDPSAKVDVESGVTPEKECCMTDNMANKIIAVIIIALQICAYILMTTYLIDNRNEEFAAREKTCYGPNCNIGQPVCMNLTTGGLMSVLLIGFLWADVVNVLSIVVFRLKKGNKLHWFGACFLILCELITAIVCGFLVGLYSENDFDAIGGAVGILFVHDLDEKVFASMQLFRGTAYSTIKKLIAVSLWVFLSVTVAVTVACKYEDGSFFNAKGELQCREAEYQCYSDSSCIWYGFVCNGIEDCSDGSDEGTTAGCIYQSGLNNDYCPHDKPFMCIEDGSCLDKEKQCDGIIDCPDGSDEGRAQNCTEVIAKENCELPLTISDKYANDTYHKVWTGNFKCNNGQCIDARFACDGQIGDCVDGSDEYPLFYKGDVYPGESACPYAQLVECDTAQVLCKIDGRCIAKSKVCDGEKDCSDGADEAQCEIDCQDEILAREKFQCGGNIAAVTSTYIVTWFDPDSENYTAELEDNTIDFIPGKTDLFDYDLFDETTGQCIPLAWRCDGVADCEDGTDEELCGVFNLDTECTDDEYQCSDTLKCIAIDFLCDGDNDCNSGEDEDQRVCRANGVDPDVNACIKKGYDYQCEGYTSFCLSSDQLCNGFPDCPNQDDEIEANCPASTTSAPTSATTTSSGEFASTTNSGPSTTLTGEFTCNGVTTGYITAGTPIYYSFRFPAQYTQAKITTCLPENEGTTLWLWMSGYDTYDYLETASDDQCTCTDGRETLLASIDGESFDFANIPEYFKITAGESYDVALNSVYYTGPYAISIECGTSAYSKGDGDSVCAVSDTDDTDCEQVETGVLTAGNYVAYAFTVDSSPVTISACGSSFDTWMAVYNASMKIIEYNDDSGIDDCYYQSYITFYPPDFIQTYTLGLFGYDDTQEGDYTITFGCGATVGASSGTTTAPPVGSPSSYDFTYCGQVLTGSIVSGGSVSYFFNIGDIQAGPITINTCGSTFDTRMSIWNESIDIVAFNNDAGIAGCYYQSSITFDARDYTQVYELWLRGNGDTEFGDYTVTYICDTTTPAPTSDLDITYCGQVLTGTLVAGGSVSYYFNIDDIQSGPITINSCGSTFDTRMSIWNESVSLMAVNDNSEIAGCYYQSSITFDAADYGQDYAQVYELWFRGNDDTEFGDYTITYLCGANTPSPTPSTSSYDITYCGQEFTGTLVAGSVVRYTFNIGNIQAGPITVSTCGSNFDTWLAIFNASSAKIVASNGDSDTIGCTEQSLISFFPTDYTQDYYVYLAGSDDTEGGDYVITYECGATSPSPIFVTPSPTWVVSSYDITYCDQEITGTLVAGEVVRYFFNIGNIQEGPITISACGSSFDTIMAIYDASVSIVAFDDNSGIAGCEDQSVITFYATDYTQDYYVLLTGSDDTQGGDYIITYGCGANTPSPTPSTSRYDITYCGQELTGTIVSGESVSYWFNIDNIQAGPITISTCGSTFDTWLAIFNDNSTKIVASNDNSGISGCSTQSVITFDPTDYTKDYFVWLVGYDDTDFGDYTITYECGANTPSPTSNLDITYCGQVLTGTLVAGGSVSLYFNIDDIQAGPITINSCGSTFDTRMSIWNESTSLMAYNDNSGIAGCYYQSSITFDAVDYGQDYAQIYELWFRGYDDTEFGDYTITYECD